MTSLFRAVKYAAQDFFRNFWLSMITVVVMVMALFAVNVFLSLNYFGNVAVKAIENKVDVSVFFRNDANDGKIFALKSKISTLPEVVNVIFRSKEDALEEFKKSHVRDAEILSALLELSENPFGASLVIVAKSPKDYPRVLDILNSAEFDDVIFDKSFDDNAEVIGRITSISDEVKKIGLFLSVLFGMVAVVVVFNTMRMTLYTHKDEIAIMKLVGASASFIRLPYVFQGFFLSLLSMVILVAILYPLMILIQPYADVFFGELNVNLYEYFRSNFALIFGVQFFVVLILNVVSSVLAVAKYHKV
ncbi:MAG: ABC transporter permease [Parcubacteria group bacterium]|nr:ABC transporter permease [Parcubacteria group bacterium]